MKVTDFEPFKKDHGLRDQIRRAAVFVASNIAEGDERDTDREAVRFLYIAKGFLAVALHSHFVGGNEEAGGKDEKKPSGQ
jgi:hypothetical protein